jgi:WD40 repeat protein
VARRSKKAHFDAFISYSRKDEDFARVVEKQLEKYVAPEGLGLESRHTRVFRDEEDLTGTDYYNAIEKHLGKSGKLIIICSPYARASQFVNDEISRFVAARGSEGLIPILYRGRPNNECGPNNEDAAFPQALCDALAMPLAVDYLGFDPKQDKFTKDRFANAWYTLLSNVFDRSRSEIEQRDQKRQRRKFRIAASITGAVMASLAALAILAWVQRGIAIEQRDLAERNEAIAKDNERRSTALLFSARAREEVSVDRPVQALGWAGAAYFKAPELPATQSALLKAYAQFDEFGASVYRDIINLDESPFTHKVSTDRTRIVTGGQASIEVLDLEKSELKSFPARRIWAIAIASDGTIAAGSEVDGVFLVDPDTGAEVAKLANFHASDLAFTPDGKAVLASAWDGQTVFLLPVNGSDPVHFDLGDKPGQIARVQVDPSGRFGLVNRGQGEGIILDLAIGEQQRWPTDDYIEDVRVTENGLLAGTRNGLVWSREQGVERFFEGETVFRVLPVEPERAFFMGKYNTLIDLLNDEVLSEFDQVPLEQTFSVHADISPDGTKALVRYDEDGGHYAEVWSLMTEEAELLTTIELGIYPEDAFFSKDGEFVYSLGQEGVRRFSIYEDYLHPDEETADLTPMPYVIETADGYVLDAEETTGATLTVPGQPEPLYFDAKAYVTAPPVLSKSRNYLLLGTKVADARLFDLRQPDQLPRLFRPKGPEQFVEAVAISDDDTLLAVAGGTIPRQNEIDGRFVGVDIYATDYNFEPLVSIPTDDQVVLLEFTEDTEFLRIGTADGRITAFPLAAPIAKWIESVPEFKWARDVAFDALDP